MEFLIDLYDSKQSGSLKWKRKEMMTMMMMMMILAYVWFQSY